MLEKISLFESLPEQDRIELEQGMHIQRFAKGSLLVNQGDTSNNLLYVVVSGRLKVFMSNDEGREVLLSFLYAGDTFGELSLFDNKPRSATVVTMETSQLGLLSRSHLITCLHRNPDIYLDLLKTLIGRMRNTTEQVGNLALLDIYGRISSIINQMAKVQPDGRLMTDKITHQDIAAMIGSSREMVTRILMDLKRGGYISIKDHRIEINTRLPLRW